MTQHSKCVFEWQFHCNSEGYSRNRRFLSKKWRASCVEHWVCMLYVPKNILEIHLWSSRISIRNLKLNIGPCLWQRLAGLLPAPGYYTTTSKSHSI